MSRVVLVTILLLGATGVARADDLDWGDAVIAHIAEIRERNPELREDAFSKMGGSSVASKAFLHCFGTEHVDLGEHTHLAETLSYFNTGRRSSFNRQSEAAGVSWNLHYVLGGKPANFRRELAATDARWALVLFGSNDAQNQNERIYLKRLLYLLEQMTEMGVVPVLGAALPRRNKSKDRWIQRFNLITEAVASHLALPYIDYHAALSALPKMGLAKDGVHPNVLPPGGYKASCKLTEEGLRYGNNVRNLLTLDALDRLRRIVVTAQKSVVEPVVTSDAHLPLELDAEDASIVNLEDAATGAEPAPASDPEEAFPAAIWLRTASLPLAGAVPKGCGNPKRGARHYLRRIELDERARLRVSALDPGGSKPRLLLVRHHEGAEPRCVRRRSQTLELDASPGMWDLIVEISDRAAEEAEILLLITQDPR
jgi:hypothetical protein